MVNQQRQFKVHGRSTNCENPFIPLRLTIENKRFRGSIKNYKIPYPSDRSASSVYFPVICVNLITMTSVILHNHRKLNTQILLKEVKLAYKSSYSRSKI